MDDKIFVPIIMFLVAGVVIVSAIFYSSKEKQMLIEKGLSADEIKNYFHKKRDPNLLMKFGIIIFFFGVGLGLGLWMQDMHLNGREDGNDFWVPFLLFTFTGVGFIVANLTDRLFKKNQDVKN